ncbi:ATPase [Shouchella lonarensis]|uniref:Uncharacterized protein n=1 Tax=Shouchella lonarensis TaxID=1464122 RepID=A0A1G6LL86_9BACI|nr:ATPase [Shouchella lonarensis]SDC44023.1 hypothetical protein SAMN05421737_108166 [Shouchella lonarensis]
MNHEKSFASLANSLQMARDQWVRLDEKRRLLQEQLEQAAASLEEDYTILDTYEKARLLLQQSAEYARKQAKQQMEQIVTSALQYVFGPYISFHIELEEHGSRAVAEMYVVSDYEGIEVKTKPQDARGGGVVDIVSLALRVALMETAEPRQEGPLLLDEPGKHVSGEYTYHLYEFLKSLSTTFGRQIVMITHNQHLTESGDRSFLVTMQESGLSELEEIIHA